MKWTKRERKAIEDSIEHWQHDIISRLRDGDKVLIDSCHDRVWKSTGREVEHMDSNCPLCRMVGLENSCVKCPYAKYYWYACDQLEIAEKGAGHWRKFNIDPCLKTALGMLNALKRLLIQEETRWQV